MGASGAKSGARRADCRFFSCGARRLDSDAGFTLIELLVSLAIFTAISLVGVSVVTSLTRVNAFETLDRHMDSTTAQFVSITFARDVQGAARLGSTACGSSSLGDPLVTLVATSDDSTVSYRARADASTHALVRAQCDSAGSFVGSDMVVDGLRAAPTITCAPSACASSGAPPRVVTLQASRTDTFSFSVDGARRATDSDGIGAVLPAELFSLGGSKPLTVQGNGNLVVTGNAFVNSNSSTAVSVNGNNARLSVTGDFDILDGGGCQGCNSTKVTPFPPGSFPAPLPDPLGYLPAPNESGMPSGQCTGGVCTPGIYSNKVTLNGNTTLQPGIYVFHRGISVTGNGSLNASGVLLFNGCGRNAPSGCSHHEGSFSISGQVEANISAMTTGTFAGVLLYQSRSNDESISITGGATVMAFSGVLYAPSSDQVDLGAGGGGLRLGAVVGRSLRVTGNGTVYVDGT